MLLLASKSPRRQQLLEQLGVEFSVIDIDVVEKRAAGETALQYVNRVSRDKAYAGLAKAAPGDVVLAGDTEVVLGDKVFGKPRDANDAARMLRRLSGREHDVTSVVWLVDGQRVISANCLTKVQFDTLDEADIAAYVATGECYGKAGAYAIQGRAAAFISDIQGSYSNVMGLPLYETAMVLRAFGLM
ncbi:MAG: Maf family protein [Dokdonella sp.]